MSAPRVECACGKISLPRERNFPATDVRYWGNPTDALVRHTPKRCRIVRAALSAQTAQVAK